MTLLSLKACVGIKKVSTQTFPKLQKFGISVGRDKSKNVDQVQFLLENFTFGYTSIEGRTGGSLAWFTNQKNRESDMKTSLS